MDMPLAQEDEIEEVHHVLSSLSLNTTHVPMDQGSVAPTNVSHNATPHATERMRQRKVPIQDVQETKKKGELVLQFGDEEEFTNWAQKALTKGPPFTIDVDRQRQAEGFSGKRYDVPVALAAKGATRAAVAWLDQNFFSSLDQKVRYERYLKGTTEQLIVVEGKRVGEERRSIITVFYREGVEENKEYNGNNCLWSGVVPLLDSFEQLSHDPNVSKSKQWESALRVVSLQDVKNLKSFLKDQAVGLLGDSICDFLHVPCVIVSSLTVWC
jgi:hypothetical protein